MHHQPSNLVSYLYLVVISIVMAVGCSTDSSKNDIRSDKIASQNPQNFQFDESWANYVECAHEIDLTTTNQSFDISYVEAIPSSLIPFHNHLSQAISAALVTDHNPDKFLLFKSSHRDSILKDLLIDERQTYFDFQYRYPTIREDVEEFFNPDQWKFSGEGTTPSSTTLTLKTPAEYKHKTTLMVLPNVQKISRVQIPIEIELDVQIEMHLTTVTVGDLECLQASAPEPATMSISITLGESTDIEYTALYPIDKDSVTFSATIEHSWNFNQDGTIAPLRSTSKIDFSALIGDTTFYKNQDFERVGAEGFTGTYSESFKKEQEDTNDYELKKYDSLFTYTGLPAYSTYEGTLNWYKIEKDADFDAENLDPTPNYYEAVVNNHRELKKTDQTVQLVKETISGSATQKGFLVATISNADDAHQPDATNGSDEGVEEVDDMPEDYGSNQDEEHY